MPPFSREEWAALRTLLDEALELTGATRSAWLAEQQQKHPALAAELAELLRRDAALDREGFLSEERAPEVPPVSLAGQTLGAYLLERPLGQGGMGSVWLARRNDGRYEGAAAIKFLSLSVAGPVGEARFRREGSALARLTHPNIARLLDAGVTSAGQPYLVLEHVDGEPLDAWCDRRRLPVEERLRLFLQVLSAVAHAHANLIVHRDLKPDNILVRRDGAVKLLDFGIAKLMEEGQQGGSALTGTHEAVLTLEYAAPEQVLAAPVSPATDVYSLAVVLYRLLAGQHPTSARCHTPAEQVRAILEADPGQLSRAVTPSAALSPEQARERAEARGASAERLRRRFAGDLDNILSQALRKDPAARYPTAAAFADDLQRFLRNEPVSARPDAWSYRAGKFLRRHRAALSAVTAVALVLIGFAITTTLQAREARRQRDAAVLELKRHRALNAVQQVLAGDARGVDGRQLSSAERVSLALEVLNQQFRKEPWLVAEVMADLSGSFYESGDRETQRAILARAQRLARAAGVPAQLALVDCLRVYSFAYDDVFDSARADLAEAKAMLAGSRAPPPEVEIHCLDAEGQLRVEEGQPGLAIPLLLRALDLAEPQTQSGAAAATDRLQLLNDLAQALRAAGRPRAASRYQREIVAGLDSGGYAQTEMLPNALSFLVSTLNELGEFAAAESVVATYVRKQESARGAGHPSTIMGFLLGSAYLRLGELDSAALWIGRAMRDTTQDRGGIESWLPIALAQLRLDQQRPAQAVAPLRQLPREQRQPFQAVTTLLHSRYRWERRDSAGARLQLEAAIRRLSGSGPAPPPNLALSLITAGEWRLAAGEARSADSLAGLAVIAAAVDSLAFSRSGLVGRAELVRAEALEREGDLPAALVAATQAVTALGAGYGPDNRWTREARALRNSLGQ